MAFDWPWAPSPAPRRLTTSASANLILVAYMCAPLDLFRALLLLLHVGVMPSDFLATRNKQSPQVLLRTFHQYHIACLEDRPGLKTNDDFLFHKFPFGCLPHMAVARYCSVERVGCW